jgi:hypothetical protein
MRRAIFALLLLAGCGFENSHVAEAKRLVGEQLRDPRSAEFRKVEDYDGLVCGEVNARNSFGGMVGFQPFYVRGDEVKIGSPGESLEEVTARARIRVACAEAALAKTN